MDGVFEKFSVFDFFNLIIGGTLFILGLGVCFYPNIDKNFIDKLTDISTEKVILGTIVLIGISLVLGSVISEIEYLVFYYMLRWEDKLISKCLVDFRVVGNMRKYEIYREKARRYFRQEGYNKKVNEFTEEESSAFFAHCVYYTQIRNQHKKSERLRDVTGLSGILAVVFGILVICDILICIRYFIFGVNILSSLILFLFYSICAGALTFRYRRALKNRIKMVLAVYDVSVEKEKSEDKEIY